MHQTEYLIIGGGIIGLSVAYQLQQRGIKDIVLLEKENTVAKHQSSHNSGVIHAGVYYKAGSLKAQFCKAGVQETLDFCQTEGIDYRNIGKILVATDEAEYARMLALYDRAKDNGITIERLNEAELKAQEPNIRGVAALFSPTTSIVNFAQVAERLSERFVTAGGQLLLGETVLSGKEDAHGVVVRTTRQTFQTKKVIVCAGLHADVLVKRFGQAADFRIIPFRGEFFQINHHENLVNHLIYPIPDPERPFLGVHITQKISGIFTVGPNAVLAGKREGYRLCDISLRDMGEIISYPGFWKMLKNNFAPAMSELSSSVVKSIYLKRVQKYCPNITASDLTPYPAGVRAQAVSHNGDIIDDFKFIESQHVLHVCNAPSPAATAAFPIGRYLVDKILGETSANAG